MRSTMCGWEDDDYETANKSMFKRAGIDQIEVDKKAAWKDDNPIPMKKRAERVTSQEREKRPKVDRGEDFDISKEAGQKKWFHDKFTFEDNRQE